MKLKSLSLLLCLVIGFGAEAQMTLNDITLPAKMSKDNTELLLNGGGIRKKFVFKVYVAGLYTQAKSKNAEEIRTADKPAAISLTITSGVINSSNMSEAIMEGFEKSLKGNTAPMKAKIDALIDIFKKEEIKEGDLFELFYVPGTGVKAYKNGKLKGTVAGLDFKQALFGIWLSATPVDEDLKKALVGG